MSVIQTGKILTNTVIRVIPIGLYLSTLLSSMMMDNKKGIILFIGQAINDIIGLAYRFLLKPRGKLECAVVRVGDIYYTMPSPYVQVVAYYFAFFLTDMYFSNQFDAIKFISLLMILLATIWSRIDVGCKDMFDVILAFSIGCGMGIVYYYMVKDYYRWKIGSATEAKKEERNGELINNVFKYFD